MKDLLGIIEYKKDEIAWRYEQKTLTTGTLINKELSANVPLGIYVWVWFYFPSISTHLKRSDFILYTPSYALTKFFYEGKPGLLCVEGASKNIDDYMKFIKTVS